MEKFTPLAKILHCRRHWRHGQIPPLGLGGLAAQKQKRDRIQNHLYPSSNLSKAALNVRIDLSTFTKSAKLYLAIGFPPGLLGFNGIYITMCRSWSVIFTIAKSPRISIFLGAQILIYSTHASAPHHQDHHHQQQQHRIIKITLPWCLWFRPLVAFLCLSLLSF